MKILCLFFMMASFFGENSAKITYSNVLKDCGYLWVPFIDNETHDSYEEVYIFTTNEWNMKLYDQESTYMNRTIKIDVHGIIKGDFEIFSWESKITIAAEEIEERMKLERQRYNIQYSHEESNKSVHRY